MNETRQRAIPREQATVLADLFQAHDMTPYCTDYSAAEGLPRKYLKVPELVKAVEGLPEFWTCDVYDVLQERSRAKWRAEVRASFEAIASPAIRAYLLAQFDAGGGYFRKAEAVELSSLAKDASKGYGASEYGPKPYQPEPGCSAVLKLREAVRYWYEQASYADHSRYAIPVELAAGADLDVCRRNLGRFCDALRTHNGFAGSGCTWSGSLHVTDAGAFVVLDCRASISD